MKNIKFNTQNEWCLQERRELNRAQSIYMLEADDASNKCHTLSTIYESLVCLFILSKMKICFHWKLYITTIHFVCTHITCLSRTLSHSLSPFLYFKWCKIYRCCFVYGCKSGQITTHQRHQQHLVEMAFSHTNVRYIYLYIVACAI